MSAWKAVLLMGQDFLAVGSVVINRSTELLEEVGVETVVCLPFQRDGYDELGMPIRPYSR